jgi:hypothetical protein
MASCIRRLKINAFLYKMLVEKPQMESKLKDLTVNENIILVCVLNK